MKAIENYSRVNITYLRDKCETMRDDNRNIFVTTCKKGHKLVILPKILFSGKRSIPWDKIEAYLKQYIGIFVEIDETKDIIHIGRDFVDEFTGSIYTRNLKGNLAKAKANMAQGIPELIECARDKRWNIDFGKKHKKKAEKG